MEFFFLFLGCQTESVTLNELCFVVQSIDGVILIYVSWHMVLATGSYETNFSKSNQALASGVFVVVGILYTSK